jgi:N-acetyl sugar amidotransferase
MHKYGLPNQIKFCKKCVMPNTRPASCNEYKHTIKRKHEYLQFDEEGVCSACRFNEAKRDGTINWKERERELIELLSKYRSKDGSYDVLVPGSGGKDSGYAAHLLKYKYGMHPLTVTWAPHLYTDIGFKNFQNWCHIGGFDNYLFTQNGKIYRQLTRNAFINLLHPFQPFILGQKTFAPKMAVQFNIPLVFYGESPGEYGSRVTLDQRGFVKKGGANEGYELSPIQPDDKPEEIFLGGKSLAEYKKEGISRAELAPYLPMDYEILKKKKIEFHYLGYYLKWIPQEAFYYSAANCGFEANPVRTEGTYSKYNSIDDKTDGYFYFTQFIKFGYGRATQDASQEIRNKHINREEGVALVKRFDGELPQRYFKEFIDYIGVTEEKFWKIVDSFRDSHLWKKENGKWKLKYQVK